MKLKDFYSRLKEQGKIEDPAYDKFLESLSDGEIPDEAVSSIESKFYTFERALAHKDIYDKIKRETLNPIDKEMADLFDTQLKQYVDDPAVMAEFKADAQSYKKFHKLKKLIPEILDKVRVKPVTDEETKKKIADYERNVQEMNEKFLQAERSYNEKLTAQKEESEKHFHDYRLDTELQNRGNKFTLAEAYEPARKSLHNAFMLEIKSAHDLRLGDKDGRPEIIVFDKETGKPKFDGNSPVTIDTLLEEKYKPLLKQSTSNGSAAQTTSQQQQRPPESKSGHRTGTRNVVG